jgi:hypothetical protein
MKKIKERGEQFKTPLQLEIPGRAPRRQLQLSRQALLQPALCQRLGRALNALFFWPLS